MTTNFATTVALSAAGVPFANSKFKDDAKAVANGDATLKDVKSREMSKFKNFLKTSAKWGVASAAIGGASTVAYLQMTDAIDITKKLPKFAQNLLNKESVKKVTSDLSKIIEMAGSFAVTAAKSHPIAAAAIGGLSAISTVVGLKLAYDHGKANGAADQKFNDTVQVNRQLKKENPLSA